MAYRTIILASGARTLARVIIDADDLDIEIVAVISDQGDAPRDYLYG